MLSLYQTQRAVENFPVSGLKFERSFDDPLVRGCLDGLNIGLFKFERSNGSDNTEQNWTDPEFLTSIG
jgi:hypothetical protein